jgi:hypothetical protein
MPGQLLGHLGRQGLEGDGAAGDRVIAEDLSLSAPNSDVGAAEIPLLVLADQGA